MTSLWVPAPTPVQPGELEVRDEEVEEMALRMAGRITGRHEVLIARFGSGARRP